MIQALILLQNALKAACMDWDGDFEWMLDPQNTEDNLHYYDVSIYHRFMRHSIVSFNAKIDIITGEVEMEFGEDSWNNLDTKNLFTFMFFETAQRLHNLHEKQKKEVNHE